ncbi:MAG: hypothetical protein AABZ30_11985 [Myxococcota bacterium]
MPKTIPFVMLFGVGLVLLAGGAGVWLFGGSSGSDAPAQAAAPAAASSAETTKLGKAIAQYRRPSEPGAGAPEAAPSAAAEEGKAEPSANEAPVPDLNPGSRIPTEWPVALKRVRERLDRDRTGRQADARLVAQECTDDGCVAYLDVASVAGVGTNRADSNSLEHAQAIFSHYGSVSKEVYAGLFPGTPTLSVMTGDASRPAKVAIYLIPPGTNPESPAFKKRVEEQIMAQLFGSRGTAPQK